MKKIFILLLVTLMATTSSFDFAQEVSWQQLNGPHGGSPMVIASTANGYVFIGSEYNQRGVYRSIDGGFAWPQANNGLALSDRSFNCILVAGSGDIYLSSGSHIGNRLYKSTDNGDSWQELAGMSAGWIVEIDSGQLFAAHTAYAEYQRSLDGGLTWIPGSLPVNAVNHIAVNANGDIFLAGGSACRSSDNGYTWTVINNGMTDEVRSIATNSDGHLFAGTWAEYTSASGIYRSTDNGDSWTAVKLGFRMNLGCNIVIDGNDNIYAGSWGQGVWKSTDDGMTWEQVNSGLGHFYIKSMHLTAEGILYAGTDGGGVYRSEDGGTSWLQTGFNAVTAWEIGVSPLNGHIFAAVNGVSRSMDFGATWQQVNNGLLSYSALTLAFQEDGTVFCGTSGYNGNPGVVWRSDDNGATWVYASAGIPTNSDVYALAVSPSGEIYAGGSDGMYKSTDDGNSWVLDGGAGGARGLAFNSQGDLFEASWGGGMWRKLHGNTTWSNITGTLYPYISSLFIGSNDYIYAESARSTDNGETWTAMNVNFGNNASGFAENAQGHLFCGTYNYGSGVWRSMDYGETWEQINDGLGGLDVRSLAVDDEGYLYAGLLTQAVFKTTATTLVSVEEATSDLSQKKVLSVYPNPLGQNGNIRLDIDNPEVYQLILIDITGRQLRVMAGKNLDKGSHIIPLDAGNLPPGIYLLVLSACNFSASAKIIVD